MMSRLGAGLAASQTATDGFFLNLSWVMLLLSAPFTSGKKTRLLNIDASYCCAERDQLQTVDSGGPLVDFTHETKLVTPAEGWHTLFLKCSKVQSLFLLIELSHNPVCTCFCDSLSMPSLHWYVSRLRSA